MELTGLAIIALWYPLGLRPGWATLLNAIEIGLVVTMVRAVLPETGSLVLRCSYLAIGLISVGVGTGIYIGAGLGSGPRDGLMLGLSRGRMTVGLTRVGHIRTLDVAEIGSGRLSAQAAIDSDGSGARMRRRGMQ